MKLKYKIIRSVLIVLLCIPLNAIAWSGKCVGVSDGDTISVMHEGKAEKIRLYGIDCPERGQPFGKRAKQFTSNMVFKKIVEVDPVTKDRYGRIVAWVYVNGVSRDRELLRSGLTWHYKHYSKDRDLVILEEEARGKKMGLWGDPNPIPPWEWRRIRRK